MLEVHHLNNSRSQRVLWLLEELGVPYEIMAFQRDTTTTLAPESLKKIHPLGKSPVIRDGDQVVIESGAILECILRKYGKGRLAPPEASPEIPEPQGLPRPHPCAAGVPAHDRARRALCVRELSELRNARDFRHQSG